MIELTEGAKQRFEMYLSRLRRALSGARSVTAEDVEQNVREHVEFALAGVPAPVGADHLAAVLERLGPPERWLPEDELPSWKRMLGRLRSGPEDWRLAYLAFALFFLTFVFMPVGGILLLVPAFVVSRACVSLLAEKEERIGARKWLIYPSMAMVLALATIAFLVVPVAGAMAWAVEENGIYQLTGLSPETVSPGEHRRLVIAAAVTSVGTWLLIAPAILALLHRPLQHMFRPLLDGARRIHLLALVVPGLFAAAAGIALLVS